MGRFDDGGPTVPPKIKAAFEFLHHARMITEQVDSSIPMRALTPLERSVEAAALRAVQMYLLGEMDFVESAPPAPGGQRDDDDRASEAVNSTR
jgi:hypothetical protein